MQTEQTIVIFLVALVCTYIAIPTFSFTPAIYGRPKITEIDFVFDYIRTWWRKTTRRILGEYGPAENVTPNPEEAYEYKPPPTTVQGEPNDVYELISTIKANRHKFSEQILDFLEKNNLPNKSAQIDLFIVPEQIYITIVWNRETLEIYDGWQPDLGCQEYIQVTITSSLLLKLYYNRNNIEIVKQLILQGEAEGELTYTIIRLNPTLAETVLWLQAISSLLGIIAWIFLVAP